MTLQRGVTLITIVAEAEGNYFFVNSPDLPGLALKGPDFQELFDKMPHLVKELYKDNYGLDVLVTKPYPVDDHYQLAIAA